MPAVAAKFDEPEAVLQSLYTCEELPFSSTLLHE